MSLRNGRPQITVGRGQMVALAVLVVLLAIAAAVLAVQLGLSWQEKAASRCAPSKFEGGLFFYEDYILSSVLADVASGTYIDVGANHPIEDSVTAIFYERNWHGITIEPNPEYVPLFAKQRPRDIHLNIGIASAEGTLTFYQITDGGAYATGGLSTFDPAVAQRWKQFDLNVSERPIPVKTLNQVLRDRPLPEITILNIDVEGFEKQLLESIDLGKHRPLVIAVEACLPGTETPSYGQWEAILLRAGYAPAMSDGLNSYYVPRDRLDLLAKFIHVDMCVKRSKAARGIKLNGWKPVKRNRYD